MDPNRNTDTEGSSNTPPVMCVPHRGKTVNKKSRIFSHFVQSRQLSFRKQNQTITVRRLVSYVGPFRIKAPAAVGVSTKLFHVRPSLTTAGPLTGVGNWQSSTDARLLTHHRLLFALVHPTNGLLTSERAPPLGPLCSQHKQNICLNSEKKTSQNRSGLIRTPACN